MTIEVLPATPAALEAEAREAGGLAVATVGGQEEAAATPPTNKNENRTVAAGLKVLKNQILPLRCH